MKSKKQIKIEAARELRKRATFAENWFWQKLRGRKLRGVKFRRQYILRGFVLDFYCPDFKLGIELDGAIHNKQRDYDKARDDLIKDLGITIIRINNEDIINNVDEMLSKVEDHLIINNIKQGASKRVLPLHGNGEGDRG